MSKLFEANYGTTSGRVSSKEPQTSNTPKTDELCKLVKVWHSENAVVDKFIVEEHRHKDREAS